MLTNILEISITETTIRSYRHGFLKHFKLLSLFTKCVLFVEK